MIEKKGRVVKAKEDELTCYNSGMKYLVGIDSGGTKTKIWLTDLQGGKIAEKERAGASITVHSIEDSIDFLKKEVGNFLVEQGVDWSEVTLITIGMAGLNSPEIKNEFEAAWKKVMGENQKILAVNDTIIGLLSGSQEKRAIVQIIGTGMNCVGFNERGERAKAGGIDYVGDQGASFEVGYQAVRAAVAAADGRHPPTVLTDLIKTQFGFKNWANWIVEICGEKWQKAVFGKVGQLVMEAAPTNQSDWVIQKIIQETIEENFLATKAVATKLGLDQGPTDVVWIGGLIQNHQAILKTPLENKLRTQVNPDFNFIVPTQPPVAGAIVLARLFLAKQADFYL